MNKCLEKKKETVSVKKTNLEWLLELSPDLAVAAIKNSINFNFPRLANSSKSLSDALETSFIWDESPEGEDHWRNIYDRLISSSQTRMQWFWKLDPDAAYKAISNCTKKSLSKPCVSMSDAIDGFDWDDSPEGGVYWEDLYHKYL